MAIDEGSVCCCDGFTITIYNQGPLPTSVNVAASQIFITAPSYGQGGGSWPPSGIYLSSSATLTLCGSVSATCVQYIKPHQRGSWFAESVILFGSESYVTAMSANQYPKYPGSITSQFQQVGWENGAIRTVANYTSKPLSTFRDYLMPGLENEISITKKPGNRTSVDFDVSKPRESWDIPPETEGYFNKCYVSIGSKSRWAVDPITGTTNLASHFDEDTLAATFTATVSMQTFESNPYTGGDGFAGDFIMGLYETASYVLTRENAGFFYGVGHNGKVSLYTNVPCSQISGVRVKLYRNGELVYSGLKPSAAQSQELCSLDGVYFLQSDVTGLDDEAGKYVNPQRFASLQTSFSSVVVDRVAPALGIVAINDYSVASLGSGSIGSKTNFPVTILATEPTTAGCNAINTTNNVCLSANITGTITLIESGAGWKKYRIDSHDPTPGPIFDYSGNAAPQAFYTLKVFSPVVSSPSATLTQIPKLTVRQWDAPKYLTLTFSAPVNAAGVNSSQLKIYKNGSLVSGGSVVPVEPMSDNSQQWRIELPEGLQTERAFIVVEYDPNGEVSSSRGACVLAARSSWLMAHEAGRPSHIDCSGGNTLLIGHVVSETDSPEGSTDAESRDTAAATGDPFQLRVGTIDRVNTEGFSPCVPLDEQSNADCSYWGLGTSIFPCPPLTVTPCAAPRIPQKHGSAIRSNVEIKNITASVVPMSIATGQQTGIPQTALEKDELTDINAQIGGADIIRLMGMNAQTFNAISTFDGKPLPQNIWNALDNTPKQTAIEYENPYDFYDKPKGLPIYGRPVYTCTGGRRVLFNTNAARTDFAAPANGIASNILRAITAARLTYDSAQLTLYAARSCQTYPALETTTLYDLVFLAVVRMVVRFEVDYEDFVAQWPPLDLPGCAGTYGIGGTIGEWFVDSLQSGEKRTVKWRWKTYMSQRVCLSKDKENTFAAGGSVLLPFGYAGAGTQWALKMQRA